MQSGTFTQQFVLTNLQIYPFYYFQKSSIIYKMEIKRKCIVEKQIDENV